MLDFIKRHKWDIFIFSGFIAICLLLSPVINVIRSINNVIDRKDTYSSLGIDYMDFIRSYLVDLAKYICYIIAGVALIFIGRRKELLKNLIIVAILAYYLSDIGSIAYDWIEDSDTSSIYMLVFDIAFIVFAIMALTDRRYFKGAILVLSVDVAFALSSTLSGSHIGMAELIVTLGIILSISLYNNEANDNTIYYN